MEVETLVKTAMEASGQTTLRPFAALANVSHPTVVKWLSGTMVPTFEQCMRLAQLAGLDPVRTAAAVRLNSKDAAPFRGLLRRLATAAACLVVAIAVGAPENAQAATEGHGVYIMRTQ